MLSKAFFIQEFQAKPWNSRLQLFIGGLLIYLLALYFGPHYGCGPGGTDYGTSSFSCRGGEMASSVKLLMIGVIALASLCWGRAMQLHEKRSNSSQPSDQ